MKWKRYLGMPALLGWGLVWGLVGCAHSQATAESAPMEDNQRSMESAEEAGDTATSDNDSAESEEVAMEFVSYQMVLLMAGPQADNIPEDEQADLQAAHLAHLKAMAMAGHMVIAGPFSDQDDPSIRGLCLYQVEGVEEARALAEADPAVVAGRLEVQVMTWWTKKGAVSFPWIDTMEPPVP